MVVGQGPGGKGDCEGGRGRFGLSVFQELQGGFEGNTRAEGEGDEEVIFVGIIDTLVPFRLRKKTEYWLKSLLQYGQNFSVVSASTSQGSCQMFGDELSSRGMAWATLISLGWLIASRSMPACAPRSTIPPLPYLPIAYFTSLPHTAYLPIPYSTRALQPRPTRHSPILVLPV